MAKKEINIYSYLLCDFSIYADMIDRLHSKQDSWNMHLNGTIKRITREEWEQNKNNQTNEEWEYLIEQSEKESAEYFNDVCESLYNDAGFELSYVFNHDPANHKDEIKDDDLPLFIEAVIDSFVRNLYDIYKQYIDSLKP